MDTSKNNNSNNTKSKIATDDPKLNNNNSNNNKSKTTKHGNNNNNKLKEYTPCIKLAIFGLVLLLVSMTIYSNTLIKDFNDDDIRMIKNNPDVYRLPNDRRTNIQIISELFTNNDIQNNGSSSKSQQQQQSSRYESPISTITWIVDRIISDAAQSEAEQFHVTNIFLHSLVGVEVFLLAIQITTRIANYNNNPNYNEEDEIEEEEEAEIEGEELKEKREDLNKNKNKKQQQQHQSYQSFSNDLACFVGALLFILHPINGEIIANVGTGRAILLSSNFILLSLLTYSKSMITSLVFFLLGCTTSVMSFSLMMLLPLYHYFVLNRRRFSFIIAAMLLITVLQYGFVMAYFSLPVYHFESSDERSAAFNIVENPVAFESDTTTRLLSVAYSHSHYLKLLVYPAELSVDWSYNCLPLIKSLSDPDNLQSLLAYGVIGLSLLFSYIGKSRSASFFFILFGLISIFPRSNIPFYSETLVSESNLYLPSIAFCIILARLLVSPLLYTENKQLKKLAQQEKEKEEKEKEEDKSSIKQTDTNDEDDKQSTIRRRKNAQTNNEDDSTKKRSTTSSTTKKQSKKPQATKQSSLIKLVSAIGLTLTIGIIVIYSKSTYERNYIWKDNVQIIFNSLESCPNNVKLNDQLATLYIKSEEWDHSKEYCEKALSIYPSHCLSNYHYGVTLLHIDGNYIEASKHFAKSISRNCAETQQMTWLTLEELYNNLFNSAPNFADLHIQYADLIKEIHPELAAAIILENSENEKQDNINKAALYLEKTLEIVFNNNIKIQNQWCDVFNWVNANYKPENYSRLERLLNNAVLICSKEKHSKQK